MIAILFLVAMTSFAQDDQFKTRKGVLDIHPVYHSALWLKWNGLTIAIDPYGDKEKYAAMGKPDLVVLTDIHGDHSDSTTLVNLDLQNAILVVPQAVKEKIAGFLPAETRMEVMANGSSKIIKGVGIRAIPMYNLPDSANSRHPKGRGNGYVLELGGKKVYISGDTEDIPEMRALKNIDIAFICMNKPYTMTVNQAASAVLEFKPKVVYPFHYRQPDGFSDVAEFERLVKAGNPKIEVRLRKWY